MAGNSSPRPLGDVVYAWATPSSHGTTTYETVLYTDGRLSCNCPGWTFKRGDTRGCKHTRLYADEAEILMRRLRAGEAFFLPQRYPPEGDRQSPPLSSRPHTDSALVPTRKRRAISFTD